MKSYYLVISTLVFFIHDAFSQGVCITNVKVISPVVAKPSDPAIVSASCSTLVVKWKGGKDQAYLVSGNFSDPVSNVSCDGDFNCSAVLQVSPGSKVNWSVQAVTVVDDRTFYSYPLFVNQEYLIPVCEQPIVIAKQPASETGKSVEVVSVDPRSKLMITNEKFAMYPNPVNDQVNINLTSEYKGNLKLSILDASGKTIKVTGLKKEQAVYTGRITVSSLKPGLYFISVEMQKGQSYITKFLKN